MSTVAISLDPSVSYPESGAANSGFAPRESFPEAPLEGTGDSAVYALVRRALHESGADEARFGTPGWNPLGEHIAPGEKVFVLPNFVAHSRAGQERDEFLAKCTHASVLRPLLDYVFLANRDWNKIGFGNAAIQSSDYELSARETGAQELRDFYRERTRADLGPHDLRGVVTRWTRYGALLDKKETDEEWAEVDLGRDSLLDELFQDRPAHVRVGDYDPRDTESFHGKGRHVYVVNRRVLEAGVLISCPKLKTHQKVGITCAIKGTVGAIAQKECLAHHRAGGPSQGGDEFNRSGALPALASGITDRAAMMGSGPVANATRITGKLLYRALRLGAGNVVGGAWHGNDTAWRMAVDIARVLRFARLDGTLADTPQRKHLALIDGIVAGENEGPLLPQPRKIGAVLWSDDIVAADHACALLMGFDPEQISLVRRSWDLKKFPLTDGSREQLRLLLGGSEVSAEALGQKLDSPFVAPKGWRGCIERKHN
jgi:hypothetical protein